MRKDDGRAAGGRDTCLGEGGVPSLLTAGLQVGGTLVWWVGGRLASLTAGLQV